MKVATTKDTTEFTTFAADGVELTEVQIDDRLRAAEDKRLVRGVKRLTRPDWTRTWAFPAYSSISEFV